MNFYRGMTSSYIFADYFNKTRKSYKKHILYNKKPHPRRLRG